MEGLGKLLILLGLLANKRNFGVISLLGGSLPILRFQA